MIRSSFESLPARAVTRVVHFLQEHRNAGIRIAHRNAATHRSRADHRRALDVGGGRFPGNVRHLGGLTLGKKQMTERLRFIRDHAVGKQLALAKRPFVEGQRHRSLDGVDGRKGRADTFRSFERARASALAGFNAAAAMSSASIGISRVLRIA